MMVLVCVQAEVSPTVPSKRRGFAGCVHQYCYRLACVQAGAGVPQGCLGHRGHPQDLGLIYRSMGRKGLESIENVGPSMAKVIEALLSPRR
jgi:hypothetical protein